MSRAPDREVLAACALRANPPRSLAATRLSPYWRPVQHAERIVVADALAWHQAGADLPTILGVPVEAVALGLLFRIHTPNLLLGNARKDQAAGTALSRYAATAATMRL